MALDFLNDISSAIGPIGQILSAIRGGGDRNSVDGPLPPSEAERYSTSLLKALADPNNSLVKQMTEEERRGGMAALERSIQAKVLADRREQSMGRSPVFFDPERADENINYQLTRGAGGVEDQARTNAMNRILAAAGVGNFARNQDTKAQNYQAALGARAEGQLASGNTGVQSRLQTGLDGLQKIIQLFGNRQPQAQFPNSTSYGPYAPQGYYGSPPFVPWNQQRYNA